MDNSLQLFPVLSLTKTEEEIILNILGNQTYKKYLQILAFNIAGDMVKFSPDTNIEAEEFIRRQFYNNGQLQVLNQLHSIPLTLTEVQST